MAFTPLEERLLKQLEGRLDEITELRGMYLRLDAHVGQHDKRIDDLENEVENTGEVYVDDLKSKLKTYEGSQSHWIRYVVGVGVTIVLLIVSAAIGYFAKR